MRCFARAGLSVVLGLSVGGSRCSWRRSKRAEVWDKKSIPQSKVGNSDILTPASQPWHSLAVSAIIGLSTMPRYGKPNLDTFGLRQPLGIGFWQTRFCHCSASHFAP